MDSRHPPHVALSLFQWIKDCLHSFWLAGFIIIASMSLLFDGVIPWLRGPKTPTPKRKFDLEANLADLFKVSVSCVKSLRDTWRWIFYRSYVR